MIVPAVDTADVGHVDSAHDWIDRARDGAMRGHGAEEVVIDLSGVEKIASRDLNELIRLQLAVKQAGRRLVLANAQENVQQVFFLTRIDRLIELRCPERDQPATS